MGKGTRQPMYVLSWGGQGALWSERTALGKATAFLRDYSTRQTRQTFGATPHVFIAKESHDHMLCEKRSHYTAGNRIRVLGVSSTSRCRPPHLSHNPAHRLPGLKLSALQVRHPFGPETGQRSWGRPAPSAGQLPHLYARITTRGKHLAC